MKRKIGLIQIGILLLLQLNTYSQPAVIVHPDDVATCSGNTIIFTIIATNATIYQWQEHDGSGWYDIEASSAYTSGETTPELTISDAIVGLNNYRYRCRVEDNVSNFVLSNDALLTVYESPLILNHPQNLDVCKTEIAIFTIESLHTSNHQWQENRGTGWYDLEDNVFYDGVFTDQLSVNTIFGINEYDYRCIVSNDNCVETSDFATLTVYPVPQVFYVTGGGAICENSQGTSLGLNDSELDMAYVLLFDGNSTGQVFSGTGNPIDFGTFYEEGTYSVEAHNPDNGCNIDMLGEAIITHTSLPEVYQVSGDEILCEGNVGGNLMLNGSEIGASYQLMLNGINTGYQLEGNGNTLTFENLITEGLYTLIAVSPNGCTSLMEGFVEVVAHPLPEIYNVDGSGYVCTGLDGVDINLYNSQEGYFYELLLNGESTGNTISGTGNSITFIDVQTAGIYTIRAENYTTGCWVFMEGDAEIMEAQYPESTELLGGGEICAGSNGVPILLNSSLENCIYEVYLNSTFINITIEGTGSELPLGIFNQDGLYTVKGILLESGCEQWMGNSVEIQTLEIPVANAGEDKLVSQSSTAQMSGLASNGSGNYTYNWEPSNLLVNSTHASTPTIPLYSTQLFTFSVMDTESGCHSLPDTVLVTVGGGPLTVDAVASTESSCSGDLINLVALASGGSGVYSYNWESIPEGFSSTLVNPSVTPGEETKYIVHLSDGTNSVSDTVALEVNPVPAVFELIGGGTYCSGSEQTAISLSNSEIGISYELIRNGIATTNTQSGTGDAISFENITSSGLYKVIASSASGNCTSEMNGAPEINLIPRPVAYAGNNFSVPIGQATTLSGTAFGFGNSYSYEWRPENLLEQTNVQNPQTTDLYSTTLYTLTVTDMNSNCISEPDSVLVSVSGSTLSISLSASSTEVCTGDHLQLLAIASGGSGEYSYNWHSAPGGFSSAIFNPSAFPVETTTYFVTVSDGSVQTTDSLEVVVNPLPQSFTVGGGGFYCLGDDGVDINLSGSETGVYYILNHNGIATDNILSGTGSELIFEDITTEGSYTIEAYYNEQACHANMQSYVVVGSSGRPTAFAGADQIISYNNSAQLEAHGFGGSGYYNYQWNPVDMVDNSAVSGTSSINLEQSQIFMITVTDQQSGCSSAPDSITVSVSGGALEAHAWCDRYEICSGEEIQLYALGSGGSGSYTYSWSSNPSGLTSYDYNPTVRPLTTTTYEVTVNDGTDQASKEIQIIVNESPVIDAGSDRYIPYGNSVELQATVSGGDGEYSYLWNPQALIAENANTLAVNTVNLYQSINFNVTVTDGNNCTGVPDTVRVNVQQENDLQLAVTALPENICKGSEVYLYALPSGGSGNYSFTWSSSPEGFTSDQFAAYTIVNENTTFTVEVSDGEHSIEKNIEVTIHELPKILDISGEAFLCGPDALTNIELINSETEINYLLIQDGFATGNNLEGTGETITFGNVNSTGYYSVLAYADNSGCSQTMSGIFHIDQAELPTTFNFEGGGEFCEQQEGVPFSLNGSETGIQYELYLNTESTEILQVGNGSAIAFEYLAEQGQYTVIATDLNTLCQNIMEGEASVITQTLPLIDAGDDQEIYLGQEIELLAHGEGIIKWMVNDTTIGGAITISPTETTSYTVQSISDFGCTNYDTLLIEVLTNTEPEVNAFTPNNDGINDLFMKDCQIEVYNRWGQVLYKGFDGWNGEYQGKAVAPGTYYYVRFTDRAGNEVVPVKGAVTVIRNTF